jgi:hypothetical protein
VAKLITAGEVCRVLGVNEDDLRALVDRGVVPVAMRAPGWCYFNAAAVKRVRDEAEVVRRSERVARYRRRSPRTRG